MPASRLPHSCRPPAPKTTTFSHESLIILYSDKYGLVYVVTKLGLLFVYDLETATAVYRTRISADPVFLAAAAPEAGGLLAVNRRGQVRVRGWYVRGRVFAVFMAVAAGLPAGCADGDLVRL